LSLIFFKIGCSNASSIEILFLGLNTKVFSKKSMASYEEPGYISARLAGFLVPKDFKYSNAFTSVTKSKSPLASTGVPII